MASGDNLIDIHISSSRSSTQIPKYENTITKARFPVNDKKSLEAIKETNHTTTRLEHIAEKNLSWGLVGSNENFITFILPSGANLFNNP